MSEYRIKTLRLAQPRYHLGGTGGGDPGRLADQARPDRLGVQPAYQPMENRQHRQTT